MLKRARIRQCNMKYEEAIKDANLAHNICPQRMEAYTALCDFLIALNDHEKALKILGIIESINTDPMIKSQFEMIKSMVTQKK